MWYVKSSFLQLKGLNEQNVQYKCPHSSVVQGHVIMIEVPVVGVALCTILLLLAFNFLFPGSL